MTTYSNELTVARSAAREAGRAILQIQQDGFETARKANRDPVTTADLEANRILKEALTGAFPGDGWLSEETRDSDDRLQRERVWIIDPLDGTKEYLQAIPEFCVSIGLVRQGRPVAGVIYNPSTDEMFTAETGAGAACNDQPISVAGDVGEKLRLAASRTEIGRGKWQPYEDQLDVRPAGSAAFKLALVARGEVDTTFTMAPRNEWDIAAGVLLVTEAGGVAIDRDGETIAFNEPDPLKNGIFAASAAARDRAMDLMRRTMA